MGKYKDEKGRFISEASLSKELAKKGLTIPDYEKARKHGARMGEDKPVKRLYDFLGTISEVRKIEQEDTDLVKHLSDMPRNRGKAYLNGERVTKMELAQYITDYAKGLGVPVYYLYLNHEFKGFDTYVNLDEELREKLEEAKEGEKVEDSHGNSARTTSPK